MRRTRGILRRSFDCDEAIFSPCRRYRYWLARLINERIPVKLIAFIMVNPSTATARKNDPTIRSCMGIAAACNASHMIVVNLFAARSTDVRHLKRMRDPEGPLNIHYLRSALEAQLVIAAWGSGDKMPKEAQSIIAQLRHDAQVVRKELLCLGTTNDGNPRHPLFVAHRTLPERWRPASAA